jgi:ribonuclease D
MCRRLIEDATRPDANGNGNAWRIRNSDSLGPHAQAVLRELWHWREQEALKANRPPFFILNHDALFSLAVALTNGGSVDAVIPKRYSPRRRASLRAAMEKAVQVPEKEWPEPRRHNGRRLSAAQKHHLENLRRRRDRNASRLQIDPTLIASRATLAALASNWAKESETLLPWQRELLAA